MRDYLGLQMVEQSPSSGQLINCVIISKKRATGNYCTRRSVSYVNLLHHGHVTIGKITLKFYILNKGKRFFAYTKGSTPLINSKFFSKMTS